MKGIVFTEFFEMVESIFSADMVDDIIDACDLETNGAYTSVGTYSHTELLQLVGALSKQSDIPVKDLVYKYGHHLFSRFHDMMPQFFEKPNNAFEFLESVHDYIHVEVKKLYPDAKLPSFTTSRPQEDKLIMIYESQCPFADFAHGLMVGCIDHYQENIDIIYKDKNTNETYSRIFTLDKNDG
jgi:hypothetical protein